MQSSQLEGATRTPPPRQAAFTHGTASPWQRGQCWPQPMSPVLYLAVLAASTGLAWGGLLHPVALSPTRFLGGGRAAHAPFLPGCLVLPLGLGSTWGPQLAPLHLLATIFGLWTGLWGRLQLHEHEGPRDHSCRREKRLRMGEACGCLQSIPAPVAPAGAQLPCPHLWDMRCCPLHSPALACSWPWCCSGPRHALRQGFASGIRGDSPWVLGFWGSPACWLHSSCIPARTCSCSTASSCSWAWGEQGVRAGPVSDWVTPSHPCHPARDMPQAVASAHATHVPACTLPGIDKPLPAEGSLQEAGRGTSVPTPHRLPQARRGTLC